MHIFSRQKGNYHHTVLACYIGYLTQALVINFSPLLFVTFMRQYTLSLSQVSTLIAVSFTTQLIVDFLASRYVEKIGYRTAVVGAHVFAVLGMVGLAILPECLPSPMLGLVIATAMGSIGGGLIEVMISPLLEACPTDEKSGSMSLLHSFYSWGQAGTILLSTLFFAVVGIEHWRLLACLWAILPAFGALAFLFVPIYRLQPSEEAQTVTPKKERQLFLLFFALMICAGAAEQVMSQWASTFAESALGIDKTLGDLLGPCMFAVLMGISRVFYGKFSEKIRLERFMFCSCLLCILSYLLAAFSPSPIFSLTGCALCGMSVGILWPGTYSQAARRMPHISMATYALLAFGGDIGCLAGPSIAGEIAEWFDGNLRAAFLFALIFPVVSILIFFVIGKRHAEPKATTSSGTASSPASDDGASRGQIDDDSPAPETSATETERGDSHT